MSDILYAVHTRRCTYLLDEDGVCRWIVSATGMVPPDVRRCVGAQFVACLDVRAPGGLVGELRIGATALFVAPSEDGSQRLVLLRTAPIQHVEFRDGAEPPEATIAKPLPLPAPPPPAPLPAPPAPRAEVDARPTTPPPIDALFAGDDDEIEADVEITADLLPDLDPYAGAFAGDETTVTLTLPLFRPEAQPPAPPTWKAERSRRGRT
jgi:hypothetical protein